MPQRKVGNLEPEEAALICDPILFRLPQQSASFVAAPEVAEPDQAPAESNSDPGMLGALITTRSHEQAAAMRIALMWGSNLTLAFRALSKAETLFFDLGLESWALRLTRLRAKFAEAFLFLTFERNSGSTLANSPHGISPEICLLEASFNIQVFRAALACGCLTKARKLLPLFSPPTLRSSLATLEQAVQGNAGYLTSFGWQTRALSVVTLHRICCLVPLGELLVTLGEQCLAIGEVGLGSLMANAAAYYLPNPQQVESCNANLTARRGALLATSRFRQGDIDGASELLRRACLGKHISELELPVALDVVEAVWVGGSPKINLPNVGCDFVSALRVMPLLQISS